jgi:type IV pilus assembly protein PilA
MNEYREERNEKGFTLIELLIAIVVIGILAAVAIIGIGGLTTTASKSSCKASQDSATTAAAAYYANQTPNAWPTDFTTLVGATPQVFTLDPGVTNPTATTLKGNGWTLTGTFSATAPPDFTSTGNGCTTP